jgi:hypothetical protein
MVRHGETGFGLLVSIVMGPAILSPASAARPPSVERPTVVVPATITSPLGAGAIPIDFEIDFAATLRDANVGGVVDPNTIGTLGRSEYGPTQR